MRKLVLVVFVGLLCSVALGQEFGQLALHRLDAVIEKRQLFDNQRYIQISELHSKLGERLSDRQRLAVYGRLHAAFFTFDFDSAMLYAHKMVALSEKIQDFGLIAESKIVLSNTLLAAGFFEQTRDALATVRLQSVGDSVRVEFYFTQARLHFDMAEYYQKSFFATYNARGLQFLDSAIVFSAHNLERRLSLNGLKMIRIRNLSYAVSYYDSLFRLTKPQGRQFAVAASAYGFALRHSGNTPEALRWLALAAEEDIRLSNKENVALMNLADLLYGLGRVDEAGIYINLALDDAKRYGALQRKNQILQILPLIEAERLRATQKQRTVLRVYSIVLTILLFVIVGVLFLLYTQYKKVQAARFEVGLSNEALKRGNAKLREVNLINEKYIGQFFKTNSDLIDVLEKYQQSVENRVISNKINEILNLMSRQHILQERKKMYHNFDTVFLTIFPNFIEKFNGLFPEEHRIQLSAHGVLNTDLRIFALIRLGIQDTEKIAQILNYSVHTINTYKTRVKNRSWVVNEDFEGEIQRIESVAGF